MASYAKDLPKLATSSNQEQMSSAEHNPSNAGICFEKDAALHSLLWLLLPAFVQSLTECMYTFTVNNTIGRICVVYLLIAWKITSRCLFSICCLLASAAGIASGIK